MKIILKDLKQGIVKLKVEDADDLWFLDQIIETGDTLSGQTWRKIKISKEDERNKQASRKKVFLGIEVEKVEFESQPASLRVLGTITSGPDDIPRGEHHSFIIEDGSIISIQKQEWLSYQLQRLTEASKEKKASILICIMDREEAFFALLKHAGYEILSSLKGDVVKKADDAKAVKTSSFYEDIILTLKEYNVRYSLGHIVLASPVFWKDELMKKLNDADLKKKVTLASCSSCDERAFNEVIKRPEVQVVLKDERAAKELAFVEKVFTEISTAKLAAYGIDQCEKAVNAGAVSLLLVTDSLIHKSRKENNYPRLESIMKLAEQTKAEVHVLSTENDAGKRLEGIGGIAALLRYAFE